MTINNNSTNNNSNTNNSNTPSLNFRAARAAALRTEDAAHVHNVLQDVERLWKRCEREGSYDPSEGTGYILWEEIAALPRGVSRALLRT